MTAHPIDAEALRRLADAATEGPWTVDDGGGYDFSVTQGPDGDYLVGDAIQRDAEFIAAARTAIPALLDALAAAEHRATRAEAQSEARRINAEYWRARVKAVEDVLDRWQVDGRDQLIPGESIRRALDGTVTPPDA